MAYDPELRRFSLVTGTVADADVSGVVYPDGVAVYRKYQLAANKLSTVMQTTVSDLQAQYSGMAGYSLSYTDPADPTYTSLTPTSGTASGGTSVTITGTGYNSATCTVTIGGNVATALTTRSNATTIVFVTPAHAAGAVNVVITTSEGTVTGTGAFTYT